MKQITVLISATAFTSLIQAQQSTQHPPNIVLILADDMGWSDLGCYGSEIRTPNLDALARDGVRFTQFHNCSKSFPSRASLITGLYAQQNGYDKDFRSPLRNAVTLGEVLRSAGYRTLWSGKHHGVENPIYRGFDHFYGLKDGACNYFNPGKQREGEGMPAQKKHNRNWCIDSTEYAPYTPEQRDFYTTDNFTNQALAWMEEYKDEQRPFFLFMAYNAPHDPLQAWKEDIDKYRGVYKDGYEKIRKARYDKQRQIGLIGREYSLSAPTHKPWDSLSKEEQYDEEMRMTVYAAMIDRLDQNIGRIIAHLKKSGKYENTLLLFMSDNGASAEVVNLSYGSGEIGSMTRWESLRPDWANVSNTPYRFFKNYSYEGGICTPLIAYWQGGNLAQGSISNYTAHFIDIMPTLVELSKATYPTEYNGKSVLPMEGESLLPVIAGDKHHRDTPLFWLWDKGGAARHREWKIVRVTPDEPWQLYNINNDPTECVDLSIKFPEQVNKLSSMYDEWRKRVSSGNQ